MWAMTNDYLLVNIATTTDDCCYTCLQNWHIYFGMENNSNNNNNHNNNNNNINNSNSNSNNNNNNNNDIRIDQWNWGFSCEFLSSFSRSFLEEVEVASPLSRLEPDFADLKAVRIGLGLWWVFSRGAWKSWGYPFISRWMCFTIF